MGVTAEAIAVYWAIARQADKGGRSRCAITDLGLFAMTASR
jgi:hypothetical protein